MENGPVTMALDVKLTPDPRMQFVTADFFKVSMVNGMFTVSCFQLDYQTAADGLQAASTGPINVEAQGVAKLLLSPEAFQRLLAVMNEINSKVSP